MEWDKGFLLNMAQLLTILQQEKGLVDLGVRHLNNEKREYPYVEQLNCTLYLSPEKQVKLTRLHAKIVGVLIENRTMPFEELSNKIYGDCFKRKSALGVAISRINIKYYKYFKIQNHFGVGYYISWTENS